MKLTNQPFVPPLVVTDPSQKPDVSAALVQGNIVKTSEHSKSELESSNRKTLATEYPMASNEELYIRDTRAARRPGSSRPRGQSRPAPRPASPASSAPKPNPAPRPNAAPRSNPAIKPKPNRRPQGGSNGTRDAMKSAQDVKNLHSKNAFPPLTSELAAIARTSIISAAAGSLISLPFSVGEHLASKAIADKISAQAKMPGAEKENVDGTKTTVDPNATEQQKIEARLEGSEIKVEVMVNTILSINEGLGTPALGEDPAAPTDTRGRLTYLEKNMGSIEAQMQDASKRYGLVYDPYIAPEATTATTDESRMGVIENRYTHMNKMLKRLIKVAEADTDDAE